MHRAQLHPHGRGAERKVSLRQVPRESAGKLFQLENVPGIPHMVCA